MTLDHPSFYNEISDHKTQLRGNLDDLRNLDRGRLELLCIAKLAIGVEDLWSKDIVDLPEKQEEG